MRSRRLLPLELAVGRSLREQGLVARGDKLLLAVSGGPDSMALLRILLALRPSLGARLEVVHFDHGLRKESAREAAWVQAQARQAGLPLHLRRTRHLAGLRSGVQAAARAWRQEELALLLRQTGAQAVATGHQLDDHLETLLLKLLRGCHLSGLQGLRWRSGSTLRPLLQVPRARLQDYLRGLGQPWLEDLSNRSLRYQRNRVRLELLPVLHRLAGGSVAPRLLELERQSLALRQWLDDVLTGPAAPAQDRREGAPHWLAIAPLLRLPPLAQEVALFRFVQRLPGELDDAHVRRALELLRRGKRGGAEHWSVQLPGRRTLKRRGSRLLLEPTPGPPEPGSLRPLDQARVRVRAPAGWRVLAGREGSSAAGRKAGRNTGPRGLLLGRVPPGSLLLVRRWAPGERFHPPGHRHPLPLARFLRDQGVPAWQRERLPVIELGGRVAAVYPRFVAAGHLPPPGARDNVWLHVRGW